MIWIQHSQNIDLEQSRTGQKKLPFFLQTM